MVYSQQVMPTILHQKNFVNPLTFDNLSKGGRVQNNFTWLKWCTEKFTNSRSWQMSEPSWRCPHRLQDVENMSSSYTTLKTAHIIKTTFRYNSKSMWWRGTGSKLVHTYRTFSEDISFKMEAEEKMGFGWNITQQQRFAKEGMHATLDDNKKKQPFL